MTKVRNSLFQHPKPQSHHAVTHLDCLVTGSVNPNPFHIGSFASSEMDGREAYR